MPLKLGTSDIAALYLGTTAISAAYLGAGQVFGGAPVFDADAAAYIAAVEGPTGDNQALEAGVKTAINDFVVGCKTDGIWDAIKASCILAGARTLAGALTPLKGAAPTNFNFVSGDYNRKTGLKGDGSTKFLNANRNNNADPRDSSHHSVFISEINTVGANIIDGDENGNGGSNTVRYLVASNQFDLRNRLTSAQRALVDLSSVGAIPFLAGHSRATSTNFDVSVGQSRFQFSTNSSAPLSTDVGVFGRIGAGSADRANARLSFYSIGESIDLAQLDTRVSALMTAIDGAI